MPPDEIDELSEKPWEELLDDSEKPSELVEELSENCSDELELSENCSDELELDSLNCSLELELVLSLKFSLVELEDSLN